MSLRVSCCIALVSLFVSAVSILAAAPDVDLNPVVGPPDPAKLQPVERARELVSDSWVRFRSAKKI